MCVRRTIAAQAMIRIMFMGQAADMKLYHTGTTSIILSTATYTILMAITVTITDLSTLSWAVPDSEPFARLKRVPPEC